MAPSGYPDMKRTRSPGRATRNISASLGPFMSGMTTSVSSRSIGDRKSTRLNSSHSQISYAVFCLKKKHQKNRLGGICEGDHWTFFFVARLAYPDGLAEALLFQRGGPEQSFILSDQTIGVTIPCDIDKA